MSTILHLPQSPHSDIEDISKIETNETLVQTEADHSEESIVKDFNIFKSPDQNSESNITSQNNDVSRCASHVETKDEQDLSNSGLQDKEKHRTDQSLSVPLTNDSIFKPLEIGHSHNDTISQQENNSDENCQKFSKKPQVIEKKSVPIDKFRLASFNCYSIRANYIIKDKIGTGSSGTVHLVVERCSGLQRAVKKFAKKTSKDVPRFALEIQLLKELDHPNIVRIYETFEDSSSLYIIMEHCRGGELFSRISNNCSLSELKAAHLTHQMFSAISYTHSNSIAHRDLKPENFLFLSDRSDSILKLIDFGLAKKFSKNRKLHSIVGSVYYLAPEVLNGSYDERCDLWSIGVILYVMLCGRSPFRGKTDPEIFQSILNNEPTFDEVNWRHISGYAKDFICRLLVKDPDKRMTLKEVYEHEWFRIFSPFVIKELSLPRHISMPSLLELDREDEDISMILQNQKSNIINKNNNSSPNLISQNTNNLIYANFQYNTSSDNFYISQNQILPEDQNTEVYNNDLIYHQNNTQLSTENSSQNNTRNDPQNHDQNEGQNYLEYQYKNFIKGREDSNSDIKSEKNNDLQCVSKKNLADKEIDENIVLFKTDNIHKNQLHKNFKSLPIFCTISSCHNETKCFLSHHFSRLPYSHILLYCNLALTLAPRWERFSNQNQLKRVILRIIARQMDDDNAHIELLRSFFLILDWKKDGSLTEDEIKICIDVLNTMTYMNKLSSRCFCCQCYYKKKKKNEFMQNMHIEDQDFISATQSSQFFSIESQANENIVDHDSSGYHDQCSKRQSNNMIRQYLHKCQKDHTIDCSTVSDSYDQLLQRVSLDGRDFLDYSDFLAASMEYRHYRDEKILKSAFRVFDRDGDGKIYPSDIRAQFGWCDAYDMSQPYMMVTDAHIDRSEAIGKEMARIMNIWDRDKDGCISYQDYIETMEESENDSQLASCHQKL